MILWSIHTYRYTGIRVRPKTKENSKFEKRTISLKTSSPYSKADFSEKSNFGVWKQILGAWHMILND